MSQETHFCLECLVPYYETSVEMKKSVIDYHQFHLNKALVHAGS